MLKLPDKVAAVFSLSSDLSTRHVLFCTLEDLIRTMERKKPVFIAPYYKMTDVLPFKMAALQTGYVLVTQEDRKNRILRGNVFVRTCKFVPGRSGSRKELERSTELALDAVEKTLSASGFKKVVRAVLTNDPMEITISTDTAG